MGSSKKQTIGYRYYMGLHLGFCHGPVDEVQKLICGDRQAWMGSVTSSQQLNIGAPDLFGGEKKEGGIEGYLDIEMGGATQGRNSYLTSRIGAAIPAFRGILGAVYRGGYISAMTPYIKPWALRVKRIREGWNSGSVWNTSKAAITMGDIGTAVSIGRTATWEYQLIDMHAGPGVLQLTPPSSGYSTGAGPFGHYYEPPSLPYSPTTDWPRGKILWLRKTITLPAYHQLTLQVTAQNGCVVLFNGSPVTDINVYNNMASTPVSRQAKFGPYDETRSIEIAVKCFDYVVTNEYETPSTTNTYFALTASSFANENVGMNPAHIIYQCLTDNVWGMGYPAASLDDAAFTAAADTLYSEGFGLSMIWNKKESIENFIKIVLDHIGGILYVRPDTGKFALRLIRADYDRNTLPQYGPSNVVAAEDYQRQAWGETVNEVTVTYTDFQTGKDSAVTVQDLANIATQSAVVAQSKSYPGINHAPLAQRVALRDLYAVSSPTSKIRLKVNRNAWAMIPGDVFRLTWPDFSISDVVFRVLDVNKGTLQDGTITVECAEDIYGLPSNTYLTSQDAIWQDPATVPMASFSRRLFELPYWDLARNLSAADLDYLDPLAGFVHIAAVAPSGDASSYDIWSRIGTAAYAEHGTGHFTPTAILAASVGKTETTFYYTAENRISTVAVDTYAVIDNEYFTVKAIDTTLGTITVDRAVLDAVPAAHLSGSMIWFIGHGSGLDQTEYADGEAPELKLLTKTALGTLALADAPSDTFTLDQRQYRPYPPGKVLVGGASFPDWIDGAAELDITWAHRDRTTQTAYLVTQSEASIGPEVGVTYTLRIYGEADTLLRTVTGLTGTTYTYAAATEISDSGALGRLNGKLRFELEAVRGGLTSWQRHNHTVRREGYGFGYGYYYGGQ